MAQHILNIIVIGGSYAGLGVAYRFLDRTRKRLSTFEDAPAYRIVLINPSDYVFWRSGASRKPKTLIAPVLEPLTYGFSSIQNAFSCYATEQFEFIHGCATSVDLSARRVTVELADNSNSDPSAYSVSKASLWQSDTDDGEAWISAKERTISYHALIFATGSSVHAPLYALQRNPVQTMEHLEKLNTRLAKAESIMIVGGGPSGCETAGELAVHFKQQLKHRQKQRSLYKRPSFGIGSDRASKNSQCVHIEKVPEGIGGIAHSGSAEALIDPLDHIPHFGIQRLKTITLVSGNKRLLPKLDPKLGAKAEKQLRKLGVQVVHNVRQLGHTTNPDGSARCILNNGTTVRSDVLIRATGAYPNTRFLPEHMLDSNGHIIIDRETLRVHGPGVGDRIYAIGDCANYSKGLLSDIYKVIPVLERNLLNDLLAHEYKLRTVIPAVIYSDYASTIPGSREASVIFSKSDDSENTPLNSSTMAIYSRSPRRTDGSRHYSVGGTTKRESSFIAPSVAFTQSPSVSTLPHHPFWKFIPSLTSRSNRGGRLTSSEAQRKINGLEDELYEQEYTESQLIPITRHGGVGIMRGKRVPSCMVRFLKDSGHGVMELEMFMRRGQRRFPDKSSVVGWA